MGTSFVDTIPMTTGTGGISARAPVRPAGEDVPVPQRRYAPHPATTATIRRARPSIRFPGRAGFDFERRAGAEAGINGVFTPSPDTRGGTSWWVGFISASD